MAAQAVGLVAGLERVQPFSTFAGLRVSKHGEPAVSPSSPGGVSVGRLCISAVATVCDFIRFVSFG